MNSLFQLLTETWSIVVPIFLLAIEFLGVATAFHAIRQVRTSQAAVAWAVGLVVMPLLVLPFYWLVGRNKFAGYREAIRLVEQQHKASVAAVQRELVTDMNAGDPTASSPLEILANVLDTPLSVGNQFELLIDGTHFYEALLDQIGSAEHYIYAEFYIIRDDEIGNQFASALCAQAKAGKIVRLLYDEVGCLHLPNTYLQRLRNSGVEVAAFNTRQGWLNRFQLNFRNHRKLLVVDGQRAIVGGLNVGDEYLGKSSWAMHWRDSAISVEGPIARKLQAVFASDYYWSKRRDLPEANWSRDEHESIEPPGTRLRISGDGKSPVQLLKKLSAGNAAVCATGPSDARARATMMFAAVAGSSHKRLWISTPYLVPDDTCINALSMARARNVDVRLLLPSKPDQWLVYLAGFYYETIFESMGIPVYRYTKGFLHQKCVLADDRLVLIGSTNLDNRSLHLNFELMLAASEPTLINEVTEMLERDFANAERKNPDDDRLLPWYIRVGTVLARLFSPVL